MKRITLILTIAMMLVITGCSGNNVDVDMEPSGSSEVEGFPTEDYMKDIGEGVTFEDGEEILITESGTYRLEGEYSESIVTVNVDKETDEGIVYLILDNTHINSTDNTPINIIEAKEVVIVLEGENTITQGSITTTDEDFPSGAIYSKADTIIVGEGSLDVITSYNDGINSRDDLIIDGATITIQAIGDGIVGKDLLAIRESKITIEAGKDGLKASNSEEIEKGNVIVESGVFNITSQNDGISAEQTLSIYGGEFIIITGGGYSEVLNEITPGEGSGGVVHASSQLEDSMKGLKGFDINLEGGEFDISAYEDAIHADNNLSIDGGIFSILSGDDGLHAEVELLINDIDLLIEYAYEGIEAGTITINGGNIDITVLDDAVNGSSSEGLVKITGGTIALAAKGDGIDANNDLTIEGGQIVIDSSASNGGGDSELDVAGTYTKTGGTVVDTNGNTVEPTMMHGGGGGGGVMPPMQGGMRP